MIIHETIWEPNDIRMYLESVWRWAGISSSHGQFISLFLHSIYHCTHIYDCVKKNSLYTSLFWNQMLHTICDFFVVMLTCCIRLSLSSFKHWLRNWILLNLEDGVHACAGYPIFEEIIKYQYNIVCIIPIEDNTDILCMPSIHIMSLLCHIMSSYLWIFSVTLNLFANDMVNIVRKAWNLSPCLLEF